MPLDEQDDERHARRMLLRFRLAFYTVAGLIAAALLLIRVDGAEPPALAQPPRPNVFDGRTSQGNPVEFVTSANGHVSTFMIQVTESCSNGGTRWQVWPHYDGRQVSFHHDGRVTRIAGVGADAGYRSRYSLEAITGKSGRIVAGSIVSLTSAGPVRCESGRVTFPAVTVGGGGAR